MLFGSVACPCYMVNSAAEREWGRERTAQAGRLKRPLSATPPTGTQSWRPSVKISVCRFDDQVSVCVSGVGVWWRAPTG